MKTDDFSYDLPPELIAQEPSPVRDACRLLVMDRTTGALLDKRFFEIGEFLREGDLLVANETRVLPARLLGRKRSGGAAEVFLLRPLPSLQTSPHEAYWEVLVRPGKRLKPGKNAVVDFTDTNGEVILTAEIIDWANHDEANALEAGKTAIANSAAGSENTASADDPKDDVPAHGTGERIARLSTPLASFDEALHAAGRLPLPPYIKGYAGDDEMYQTVFSRRERSAAAPTAGLHFTTELINRLKAKGVDWATVDLEVGLDTFRIVEEDDPRDHRIHTEFYTVSPQTAQAVNEAKRRGGRIIAVGTTSVRSLESAFDEDRKEITPRDREQTSLFIMPGYDFRVIDGLITNFHVPRSTLMMLVSAFCGRDHLLTAYRHAICEGYRFLSFGDAMLLI